MHRVGCSLASEYGFWPWCFMAKLVHLLSMDKRSRVQGESLSNNTSSRSGLGVRSRPDPIVPVMPSGSLPSISGDQLQGQIRNLLDSMGRDQGTSTSGRAGSAHSSTTSGCQSFQEALESSAQSSQRPTSAAEHTSEEGAAKRWAPNRIPHPSCQLPQCSKDALRSHVDATLHIYISERPE